MAPGQTEWTPGVTCAQCGWELADVADAEPCPACGSVVRRDVRMFPSVPVAIGAQGGGKTAVDLGTGTIKDINRFAGDWFRDACSQSQASLGDLHARRREILFAVCCAESYLYEWTYALLGAQPNVPSRVVEAIDRYFPRKPADGWNRGLTAQ